MRMKLFIILACVGILNGCCHNPNAYKNPMAYKNYCQRDYWHDSDFEIFGRKNCVGDTGRWIDQGNGRSGYFCTGPKCKTYEKVTCKDICTGCSVTNKLSIDP